MQKKRKARRRIGISAAENSQRRGAAQGKQWASLEAARVARHGKKGDARKARKAHSWDSTANDTRASPEAGSGLLRQNKKKKKKRKKRIPKSLRSSLPREGLAQRKGWGGKVKRAKQKQCE